MSKPWIFGASTFLKAFRDNLNLNDNAYILQGNDDPTSVAKSAPQGSVYFRTGASGGSAYIKQDAGSSTNWQQIASTALVGSSSSAEVTNLGLGASVGSSALTLNILTATGGTPSGGSPVTIGFRDTTAGVGQYSSGSVTSATSLVISSGSTLGHSSANDHYIYVYAILNGSTVELAVSSVIFDDGSLVSTTAEGGAGAADSNRIMYSTTARSNVPCRLIGRLLSNQTTAGTWASAPSEISVVPFRIGPVVAKYRESTGGATLSSGGNPAVDFDTREVDSHNAVTGAGTGTGGLGGTFTFTSPKTAVYALSAAHGITSATGFNGTSEYYNLTVQINASPYEMIAGGFPPSTATDAILTGATSLPLNAGDAVTLDVRQQSGNNATTNVSTNSRNHYWFSIVEIMGA